MDVVAVRVPDVDLDDRKIRHRPALSETLGVAGKGAVKDGKKLPSRGENIAEEFSLNFSQLPDGLQLSHEL